MSVAKNVAQMVDEQRVIVCCGAGGVGKTTTAAALGIAGAMRGKSVLVLTVDPSLRLAEALGVDRNAKEPTAVAPERLQKANVSGTGKLEVWMLDAKSVADATVARLVKDPAVRERLESNRLYQQVTSVVTGMHEYAAMAALHGFVQANRYDLIILDTPPSRNALDFLDAPGKVTQFLDGKIVKLFLPNHKSFFGRASAKVVSIVLPRVLGEDFAADFSAFLGGFSGVFNSVSVELSQMRRRLTQPDVSFVLITTPAAAAVTEAFFFQDRVQELNLPFAGFILNRAALVEDKVFPSNDVLPPDSSPALVHAFDKLKPFARLETLQAARDQGLWAELALRTTGFATAVPTLFDSDDQMQALGIIASRFLSERRNGPRL